MRLFALCVATTHLPLLGYVGWGLVTGRIAWAEFVILTLATATGMAATLLGIGALLNPVQVLADRLPRPEEYADRAPASRTASPMLPPMLPDVGSIIARLHAGVRRAAANRARIGERDIAAHEDPLTGIANRLGFLAQLDALPPARKRGCIAIIDIDHFQQVNDLFGHEAGDRVLGDFAARLSSQIRRADIIARWGGEEFAIFYQDSIEDEASWSLARIAERMRREPVGEISGQPISFSAGLSRWQGGPAGAAIAKADEALHRAKRSGRDQVQRAERHATPPYL